MNLEDKKKRAYRAGVIVLFVLFALTLIEFFIAISAPYWWAALMGVVALKAFFVIRDYMHVGRVFSAEEDEAHS
jgi:hypothetical protein